MNKQESTPDKTIDCIGLYCPEPLFRTRTAMDQIETGQVLEVIADDPAAEEDLRAFAKRAGHEIISMEKKEGELRVLIRKGTGTKEP